MSEVDFSKLESIFRMVTPTSVIGTAEFGFGSLDPSFGIVEKLSDALLCADAHGTLTYDALKQMFDDALSDTIMGDLDQSAKEQLQYIIRMYGLSGYPRNAGAFATQCLHRSDTGRSRSLIDVKWDAVIGGEVAERLNKLNKRFSCFLLTAPFMTPALRSATKVETWMNGLPTLIASRCVPYCDVEFMFNRPPESSLDGGRVAQTTSLLKFLEGPIRIDANADTVDAAFVDAAQGSTSNESSVTSVGMEIFTSPQTLVNTSPEGLMGRYTPVLDPFRPMATLKGVTISIAPSVGFYTFKTAEMSLVIHDRSRFAEFSELIRPQLYNNVSVWITYGWRHPHEIDNPYAEFINNNMLVREAFGVHNMSLSFENTGEVNVKLSLHTKNVQELRNKNLTSGLDSMGEAVRALRALTDKVKEIRQRNKLYPAEGVNAEARIWTLLDAAESADFTRYTAKEAQAIITNAQYKLKELQRNNATTISSDELGDLFKLLNNIFKANSSSSEYSHRASISRLAENSTVQRFKIAADGFDPFFPHAEKYENTVNGYAASIAPTELIAAIGSFRDEIKTDEKPAPEVRNTALYNNFKHTSCSLGRLISIFLSTAVADMPNVDEVQLFFYQFNAEAGALAGHNIAEFPVDLYSFMHAYKDAIESRGEAVMTLEQFLALLTSHAAHPRAIPYGLRRYYKEFDPKNPESREFKAGEQYAAEGALLMKQSFRPPQFQVFIETVHAANDAMMNTSKIDPLLLINHSRISPIGQQSRFTLPNIGSNVVRFHVYDKQHNPFMLDALVMRSERGEFAVIPNTKKSYESFQNVIKSANDNRTPDLSFLMDQKSGTKFVNATSSDKPMTNAEIKRFVSSRIPTIRLGQNAGAVESLSITSNQDQLLSTVNMLRTAEKKPALAPSGAGLHNLPLRVIPMQMQMTSLGCPIIYPAQLFFVDCDTGTTLDNMYIMTNITHTIGPGTFKTSAQLAPWDAYGKFESSQRVVDSFIEQYDGIKSDESA